MRTDLLHTLLDEADIKHLINAAINNEYDIFTIDKQNNRYQLDNTQLLEVISKHPDKAQVYFTQPSKNINAPGAHFGSWGYIGINELLGDISKAKTILALIGSARSNNGEIHPRRENTLLKIIAAMLKSVYSNIDPTKQRGLVQKIARDTDKNGYPVSEDTIADIIKDAQEHYGATTQKPN